MNSAAPAPAGRELRADGARGPQLAVVLAGPTAAHGIFRVDAPDRVLRMWELLNATEDVLHQVKLAPEAQARLHRQLAAVESELERSVSPALAMELRHLTGPVATASPTADGLRVEYANLLGWTGGLVIGMLRQIEEARPR